MCSVTGVQRELGEECKSQCIKIVSSSCLGLCVAVFVNINWDIYMLENWNRTLYPDRLIEPSGGE